MKHLKREDFPTYEEWIDYCYDCVKAGKKKKVYSAPYKGVKY